MRKKYEECQRCLRNEQIIVASCSSTSSLFFSVEKKKNIEQSVVRAAFLFIDDDLDAHKDYNLFHFI